MISRLSLAIRVCVIASILAVGAGRGVAQSPKPSKKQSPPPTVFVHATSNYRNGLTSTEHTVNYAAEFAAEFAALGYSVRFATDTDSAPTARKKLKGVTVEEVNDGGTLSREVHQWMRDATVAQSPLAILVLSGHGRERGDGKDWVPYYLCRDDDPGTKGVSLTEIEKAATQPPGTKLFVIYNACRTRVKGNEVPVKAPEPAKRPARSSSQLVDPSTLVIVNTKLSPTGFHYPTVLYATQPDEVAIATEDLIFWLTKGLRFEGEVRQALTTQYPELGHAQADLRLYQWFLYVTTQVLTTRRFTQQPVAAEGAVPLATVVRRVVNGKPRAPTAEDLPIDLLKYFTPTAGDLERAFSPDTGLTITKPRAGLGSPWAECEFANNVTWPVVNRMLELDVVARKGDMDGKATNLDFEVHAKNGVRFLSDPGAVGPIAFNQLTRVYVPLNTVPDEGGSPYAMSRLALVSERQPIGGRPPVGVPQWPVGASLTVVGVKLVPRPLGDRQFARNHSRTQDVNLLHRWHYGDPGESPRLDVRMEGRARDALQWQLHPTAGANEASRCGGRFAPDPWVYVPQENVLEVEASSTTKGTFTVELMSRGGDGLAEKAFVEPKSVTVGPGVATKTTLKLVESGYADYLAVTTSDPNIRIKSLKIRPALMPKK